MRVPLPQRHHKSIALLPVEVGFTDACAALAAYDMVDRRAGWR